jgi:hypothetical protein
MPVEVYFVGEGAQEQRRPANYTLSLADCVEKLGLKKSNWHSQGPPRFEERRGRLRYNPPKHVVVKLDEDEAKASGWRAGYYRVEMNPRKVVAVLGEPRQ